MYQDSPLIEVIVDLQGIPEKTIKGADVTVNFLSKDINNQNVFYTDSNQMEMVKRTLNEK